MRVHSQLCLVCCWLPPCIYSLKPPRNFLLLLLFIFTIETPVWGLFRSDSPLFRIPFHWLPYPKKGPSFSQDGARLSAQDLSNTPQKTRPPPISPCCPRASFITTTQGYHKLLTLNIRGLKGEMLIVFRSCSSPSWLTSHMEEVYVKLMFTGSAICNIILNQTILVNTYSLFLCWTLGENGLSSCFNVPSSIIYNIPSYKWQLTKT